MYVVCKDTDFHYSLNVVKLTLEIVITVYLVFLCVLCIPHLNFLVNTDTHDTFTRHLLSTSLRISFFYLYHFIGNAAWAHICAKNKLKSEPKAVAGLPIFITDETSVTDTIRFTQRVNVDMEMFKIKPTSWSIPFILCYILAMLVEMALKVINLFTKYHVQYCPRGMLAFASSLILYDRLRSAISLDYEPIYDPCEGYSRSGKWYDLWYQNYKNEKLSSNHDSSKVK